MASSDGTAIFANILRERLEVTRTAGGGWFYTLESCEGLGLLTPVDRELGEYFMFWGSRLDAERYLASRTDAQRNRVTEISYRDIDGLVQQGRADGHTVVILDRDPDDSSRVASIDKFLSMIRTFILKSEARLGEIDEFLGDVDALTELGLLADDDERRYLPVDCPDCDTCFSLHEFQYRRWRLGHTPKMLCPNCSSIFSESSWEVMQCLTCEGLSKLVPASIARKNRDPTSPGRKWRCEECLAPELNVEAEMRLSAVRNERESNAASKGCLTIFVTLLVILCGSLLII